MVIKNILIMSAVCFLVNCQTTSKNNTTALTNGSPQHAARHPAETLTLGNPVDSTTNQQNKILLLQDLQMTAKTYIPQGSKLRLNSKINNQNCNIKVTGPEQLVLGDLDEDAAYTLDYQVPSYANNQGFFSNRGSSGGGLYLPLDKSEHYLLGNNRNIMYFALNAYSFYKDGQLSFFVINNEDVTALENGQKKKSVYITKHTIEIDPLLKTIKSMTTEIRFGDAYSDVSNFEKMPLQARTTCENNNNISMGF